MSSPMKKISKSLGLAVAAAAALTVISCQKESNTAGTEPERHPVSFDLSLGSPDTKIGLDVQASGNLKASWAVNDEVAVIWGDSDPYNYEKFTVTAVSADGKTATFENASSAFPTSGNVTFGVYYPYHDYHYGWFASADIYGASGFYKDNFDLAAAGRYAYYGAWGLTATDGVFPAIQMEQLCSFFKIPAGTSTGCATENIFIVINKVIEYGYGAPSSWDLPSTPNFARIKSTVNDSSTKKTKADIYMPVFPNSNALEITMSIRDGASEEKVSYNLGTKAIEAGKVYDLSSKLTP